MEEDGKIFSDYDVDMKKGRTWLEGVKLVESGTQVNPPTSATNFDNKVFKIKLKNDGTFFHVASKDSL